MIRLTLTDSQGVRLQQLLAGSNDPADKALLSEIRDQIEDEARRRPDEDDDEETR